MASRNLFYFYVFSFKEIYFKPNEIPLLYNTNNKLKNIPTEFPYNNLLVYCGEFSE